MDKDEIYSKIKQIFDGDCSLSRTGNVSVTSFQLSNRIRSVKFTFLLNENVIKQFDDELKELCNAESVEINWLGFSDGFVICEVKTNFKDE